MFLVPRNQYGEFIDVFSYNLVNPGITWVNGTEMGQKWATFIFFTDAYNLLSHPGDGSLGINTTLGYHYVIPSEKNLRIFLKEPVDPEKVNLNILSKKRKS